tara:strand:+ start:1704 stop:2105 length:402 start_codon:yes stop_codon:yes gene_type:complete
MKIRLLQLFLHTMYIAGLIFFMFLFYLDVKNIVLTYFIVIISFTLFFLKLIYWYSIKNYEISLRNSFLLKITVCVFIYISPVYCIIQEPFLIVNNYISLITLSFVTFLAIIGIYIERWLFLKESEEINYEKKI